MLVFSGERGIRTPGPLTVNGFQDRRNRPLCHLSGAFFKSSAKVVIFLNYASNCAQILRQEIQKFIF